jgi:hypothetical protein
MVEAWLIFQQPSFFGSPWPEFLAGTLQQQSWAEYIAILTHPTNSLGAGQKALALLLSHKFISRFKKLMLTM